MFVPMTIHMYPISVAGPMVPLLRSKSFVRKGAERSRGRDFRHGTVTDFEKFFIEFPWRI